MTVLGDRPQLVRNVRLTGPTAALVPDAPAYDLLLADGVVADVAPAGNLRVAGDAWDADGMWAVPGLWDHHVHMTPWAVRRSRASLVDATTAAEAAAIAGSLAPDRGVRIAVNLRDALWSDEADLAVLDAATGEVPTYLVNQDLHSIWLNSAALRREGITGAPDGMLRETPAFEVGKRLDDMPADRVDAFVAEALDAAAARGVVGICDLDMGWNAEAWLRRSSAGFDAVRVRFGIYPGDLARAIGAGLRTGETLDERGLVRVGSLKVITDGSLGTRTAACRHPYGSDAFGRGAMTVPADEVLSLLATAAAGGLDAAVHAIGDVAVSYALDAFAATGAGGSVEHAQLVAHADLPRFARLGVTASVQPTHAVDDRDLAEREWGGQTSMVYPLRSLFEAGANVAFGSDAPVAPLDPWASIADAVDRTADHREAWQGHERVDSAMALAASSAGGSAAGTDLSPGSVADIAFCAADPLAASGAELRGMHVGATLLGGRFTHLG